MADRRPAEIAIEEKRARLAELRRARDERKALLVQGDKAPAAPLATSRRDVNDLVESLVGSTSTRPASPYASSSRRPPATIPAAGLPASTPGASVPGTPGGRTSRLSNDGSAVGERWGTGGRGRDQVEHEGMGSPFQPAVDYVDHHSELYELPSKTVRPAITYSKAIQTMTSMGTSTSDVESDGSSDGEGMGRRRKKARDGGSGRETEDEMRKRILEELELERKALEKELSELKENAEQQADLELSNEQRQAVFAAPDFSAFLDESSRIVQRALSDGYDYIKDYTIGLDGAFGDDREKVKRVCAFSDERWTNGRSITDLDWSGKFHELVVAAYTKNPAAPNDPDGIVAVWNLHLLERPEYTFHSPSDVLSVAFSPFHPTLIFGGSYSGQILLWDTRAKHLPVLRTPISASGHTYPIYGLNMIGTQNANNLISSSTDGLVCTWQADMLAQPQETLLLSAPSHSKTDEVSITCLDFPDNETATFWVGTEEGSVYQANRYDRASAKAGLNYAADDIYRGHAGPVTGLDFHPGTGSIDFSDLLLTSSVDWTVKLWRAKTGAKTQQSQTSGDKSGIAPFHSFEHADDYVFDVKWHPNHPAVFGTADGTGKFDLWNLNQDAEVPTVSTQVCSRAINKLAWDRTPSSRKAGLGSSDGKLYVYDVAEKLVSPRDNEWAELQKTVQALTQNRDSGGAWGAPELPVVGAGRYR